MKKRSIIPGDELFNSRLSFKPLVNVLQKSIDDGKPGASGLYNGLLTELSSYPLLLQPITDSKMLEDNKPLIEKLLATVFPVSLSEADCFYAVGKPFRNEIIYASSSFKSKFMKPGSTEVLIPNQDIQDNLQIEKLHFAYGVSFKSIFHVEFKCASLSMLNDEKSATGTCQ